MHLSDCLESLRAQTFEDFETILVDNGSSDNSLDFVGAHYPWVKTVALPVNRGFATGNNIGYLHTSGDYIVTLNNDTVTETKWLEQLIGVVEDDSAVGMVASRICSYWDYDVIDSLGVKLCCDGMSRGAFRLGRFSLLKIAEMEEILMPSACAALYRRSMIESIGFFDEDFFAYCEDTDLGLRGRLAGWGAVLARDAVVYHKYSQTGGAFSPLKLYLVERNHYWVAFKTYPASWIAAMPLCTMWRYLVQARVVLARRGVGKQFAGSNSKNVYIKAIAKGLADALRTLPKIWAKRRMIASTRILDDHEFGELLRAYRLSFRELFDAG